MSRKAAINSFCLHCIYDPLSGSGTWRQQVEACTSSDCALFSYRPKSTNGKKQQFKRAEGDLPSKRTVATNDDMIVLYDAKNPQIAPSTQHKEGELS